MVTVLLGTVPQGQGHATVARQVVADRLGLPGEAVGPVVELDTATTPWTVTSGSYSSTFSPLLTSAPVAAADKAAARIRTAAGVLLDVEADALELADGQVRVRDDPGRAVAFRHAAGLVHWDPGSLPAGAEPGLYVEAAVPSPQAQHADSSDHPTLGGVDLPVELSGILCRCTGHRGTLAAVRAVAARCPDGVPPPGNPAARRLVGRRPADGP